MYHNVFVSLLLFSFYLPLIVMTGDSRSVADVATVDSAFPMRIPSAVLFTGALVIFHYCQHVFDVLFARVCVCFSSLFYLLAVVAGIFMRVFVGGSPLPSTHTAA